MVRSSSALGKSDLIGAVPFGLETRLTREQFVEALGDDRRIRKGLRLVETDQDVAGVDPVAFSYAQLSDDTAGRMLNLLDARIHNHDALADHRTGQLAIVAAQPPMPNVTKPNMTMPTIM